MGRQEESSRVLSIARSAKHCPIIPCHSGYCGHLTYPVCGSTNGLRWKHCFHLMRKSAKSSCCFIRMSNVNPVRPLSKKLKREDYRKAHEEVGLAELPKKKFYRQRAHANPFSDHQLT